MNYSDSERKRVKENDEEIQGASNRLCVLDNRLMSIFVSSLFGFVFIGDCQKKIQIIVMCFSDNIFESFKFYSERGDFRQMAFPFYFDNKESLEKLNAKIDFQSEILLLDNKNRVIRGYNQSEVPFDKLLTL
jgi:hypothetical protein